MSGATSPGLVLVVVGSKEPRGRGRAERHHPKIPHFSTGWQHQVKQQEADAHRGARKRERGAQVPHYTFIPFRTCEGEAAHHQQHI